MLDEDGRLFDEEFFMYGEDVLLTWKARQRGYEDIGRASCRERV